MPARIRRITFDCPDARTLSSFYAELLAMPARLVDGPERVVIGREGHGTDLAFAAVPDYRPPTWPDPAYPQQLHLDIRTYDAECVKSADQSEAAWFSWRWHDHALALGATRLPHLGGGCPVYADPAGHPFCLCAALPPSATEETGPAEPVGSVVFDCFDSARRLASFYAELLDMHVRMADREGWVKIRREDGARPTLSFGGADGRPPRWSDPERPQQVHLDIQVDDIQATENLVLRLGANRLTSGDANHAVYADPEGHPFCLYSSAG